MPQPGETWRFKWRENLETGNTRLCGCPMRDAKPFDGREFVIVALTPFLTCRDCGSTVPMPEGMVGVISLDGYPNTGMGVAVPYTYLELLGWDPPHEGSR